jgi:hypothetical protein
MRTKCALPALALVALVLQSSLAQAVPNRRSDVRWEGAIEPQAARLILYNLSARPAEASLGSAVVAISADGVAEIPASGLGADQLRLRSEAHLPLYYQISSAPPNVCGDVWVIRRANGGPGPFYTLLGSWI